MRVAYQKLRPAFPDLERATPRIPPKHRELARLRRPPALPHQCPPWVAAGSLGVVLRYPYDAPVTVRADERGVVDVEYGDRGLVARAGGPFVELFSSTHFSIRSGYRFRTPPVVGLLVRAVDFGPPVVPGVVETWWYPRPLFVVLENPAPGSEVRLAPGQELCILVPVLCEEVESVEMSAAETDAILSEDRAYLELSAAKPRLSWVSVAGVGFSHRYRLFSRLARRELAIEPGSQLGEGRRAV